MKKYRLLSPVFIMLGVILFISINKYVLAVLGLVYLAILSILVSRVKGVVYRRKGVTCIRVYESLKIRVKVRDKVQTITLVPDEEYCIAGRE